MLDPTMCFIMPFFFCIAEATLPDKQTPNLDPPDLVGATTLHTVAAVSTGTVLLIG